MAILKQTAPSLNNVRHPVQWLVFSKEGYADNLPAYWRTHYYWCPWKMYKCKHCFLLPTSRAIFTFFIEWPSYIELFNLQWTMFNTRIMFKYVCLLFINNLGLFNAKSILLEEQWWYYSTHSWEDKGVHTFPKGICPTVNVIVRLEFELAYNDSAVQRLSSNMTLLTSEILIFYHYLYSSTYFLYLSGRIWHKVNF